MQDLHGAYLHFVGTAASRCGWVQKGIQVPVTKNPSINQSLTSGLVYGRWMCESVLNPVDGATNGVDLSSPSDPVSAGARLVGYNYAP